MVNSGSIVTLFFTLSFLSLRLMNQESYFWQIFVTILRLLGQYQNFFRVCLVQFFMFTCLISVDPGYVVINYDALLRR